MYEYYFHTMSYGVNFLLAINKTLEELCENYKLQPQEDLYKKQGSDLEFDSNDSHSPSRGI
ncbi:hypothetical protein DICPUDRAFT_159339 [Dictyostelium purpureum]|uniref:Uncharacterized protein n=1 Tax=Dictyostelium purpureum TaxID=5786 RepID=F1A3V8_DICPU|nr:uncharacterized protein DICPUDRAFT_159339 [Dictyostelium purpureum]EGC29124.1 hypothetical protein DICPUDRAFT_159339 [Dictyostelium purpureum]|eukprot:XP_003294353.1 hypothetical protein DICPUDRAFT_159339 [Dictyostelium purpureum]